MILKLCANQYLEYPQKLPSCYGTRPPLFPNLCNFWCWHASSLIPGYLSEQLWLGQHVEMLDDMKRRKERSLHILGKLHWLLNPEFLEWKESSSHHSLCKLPFECCCYFYTSFRWYKNNSDSGLTITHTLSAFLCAVCNLFPEGGFLVLVALTLWCNGWEG